MQGQLGLSFADMQRLELLQNLSNLELQGQPEEIPLQNLAWHHDLWHAWVVAPYEAIHNHFTTQHEKRKKDYVKTVDYARNYVQDNGTFAGKGAVQSHLTRTKNHLTLGHAGGLQNLSNVEQPEEIPLQNLQWHHDLWHALFVAPAQALHAHFTGQHEKRKKDMVETIDYARNHIQDNGTFLGKGTVQSHLTKAKNHLTIGHAGGLQNLQLVDIRQLTQLNQAEPASLPSISVEPTLTNLNESKFPSLSETTTNLSMMALLSITIYYGTKYLSRKYKEQKEEPESTIDRSVLIQQYNA